ncbi:MAG: hypothetical protein HOM58_00570 [Rhodospirillaceae bacterium]|jgi:hypothetical protein|nr:hypothetical protein [Rhodospirillaceae bacterium]MBT5458096.1 hypothetical protein [Rhodospirillaceae bacterium]
MIIKFLSVALAGTVLTACAGADLRTDYQISRDRAAAYIAANPALSPRKQDALRKATLLTGMSKRDVIASWGRPAIVQKYHGGSQEYWLFGCHWPHTCSDSDDDGLFPMPEDIFNSRALFENGKLVRWQS